MNQILKDDIRFQARSAIFRTGCFSKKVANVLLCINIAAFLSVIIFDFNMISILFLLITVCLDFMFYLSFLLYSQYWKKYLEKYLYTLVGSGIGDLNITPKAKAFPVYKKVSGCGTWWPEMFHDVSKSGWEYEVAVIFLTDDYLVIYKGCPKYNLFMRDKPPPKHKFDVLRKPKGNCPEHLELYYSYIQFVDYYEGELRIMTNSGVPVCISCDKPTTGDVIKNIRIELRKTERRWQLLQQQSACNQFSNGFKY